MPHAQIATTQAVYTLKQLHAELAGKIMDNDREAERLRQSMVHVEAVLKMLAPGENIARIAVRRRKPNPWFKRGTLWRAVLDVLRGAHAPMTVPAITAAMLAAKGVQEPAPERRRDLEGAVRAALKAHDGRGVWGEGMPLQWASSRP